MTHYVCDLCGADTPVEMPFTRRYLGTQALHACGRCGLVYQPDRRDWATLEHTFTKGYFEDQIYIQTPATRERQLRALRLLETVGPFTGKRVVDVGAGEGEFLLAAQRRGNAVVGVEPSKVAAARANARGVSVHEGFFEEWADTQPADTFDVATFIYVLETMTSPAAALRACRRLLTRDGLVLVSTGNRLDYERFPFPLARILRRGVPRELHPYNWSVATLEAMLNVNGFTVVARDWREPKSLVLLARACEPYPLEDTVLDSAHRLKWYFRRWHFASYRLQAAERLTRTLSRAAHAARGLSSR